MNRLSTETSPYLRQHADNPVDWWPWCEEAFEEARRRDVPVLLSVGYSACHWCHVMAHESFEDETVARAVNDRYVCVKVDREERPDVDAVYMDAVMAVSGSGGWPMTVWLLPDGRPYFAGTYFPKERAGGRPSFLEAAVVLSDAYHEQRTEVEEQAEQLADAVRQRARLAESLVGPDWEPPLASAVLDRAVSELAGAFDDQWGGFGSAPKFPQPSQCELLLLAHRRSGDRVLLDMVATTLDAMASGGIYDHLGGGFARYSVDRRWVVPHFEKMLYDNAGLARLYTRGWKVTGNPAWRQVVEETVEYVRRDLGLPAGGVASAEDADSEGEEGRFYVWSLDEVRAVGGDAAVGWYGVTEHGNFEGRNILVRPVRGDLLRPPEVEQARQALLDVRGRRVRPGLDDKVLTEWNAMWVAALAEAGAAMGRADWLASAEATAEFLLGELRVDGRWRRSWQAAGGARHLAYAVDHAWLVEAFTRLAEATGRRRWLDEAVATAEALVGLFWDDDARGFFTTGHDAERLLVRAKETYDGATPSASSVAAVALVRLGALTGDERWTSHGRRTVDMLSPLLGAQPTALTYGLAAVDLLAHGTTEIAVTGDRPDLVAEVQRRHLPEAVLAWGERYPSPLWEGRDLSGAAYVCRSYACQRPVTATADLVALLD